MASDINNQKEGAPTPEQLRRDARRRVDSPATQEALREAIFSVAGVTAFDAERVMEQLEKHLNDFLGCRDFKDFRARTVAWVTRQAQLIAITRELLQSSASYDATFLFTLLPTYKRMVNVDSVKLWADSVTQLKAEASAAVSGWVSEYRRVVYAGIWEELRKALDLGVGSYVPVTRTKKATVARGGKSATESDYALSELRHPVVEEIASDVWMWVYANSYDLLTSPVPIHSRLKGKAKMTAFLWKMARLQNRDQFKSFTQLDQQREQIEKLIEAGDAAAQSPGHEMSFSVKQLALIHRAQDVDLANVGQLEQTLYDAELGRSVAESLEDDEPGEELALAA